MKQNINRMEEKNEKINIFKNYVNCFSGGYDLHGMQQDR